MQKQQVKTIIERLIPVLEAEPRVIAGYIFGSVAKGTETPMSDLDLAILIADSSDETYCMDLTKRLTIRVSEVLDILKVDLICLNQADVAIRNSVVRDGILFYDKNPVERAQFERLTWDEYEDMQRLWEEYDRYMLKRFMEEQTNDRS
ncbi:MAG: nucleotidyltransferase domain-containing protein [Candidatus Thorarchaeota archaeon]|nr:nucleotidyltransferase domain-containing protein [Candidatus Thorarchaeota archaeon]